MVLEILEILVRYYKKLLMDGLSGKQILLKSLLLAQLRMSSFMITLETLVERMNLFMTLPIIELV